VPIEFGVVNKRAVAQLAPNAALVFRQVVHERVLVGQHLAADAAGRGAQVHIEMTHATRSVAVRLLAHAANEPPVLFHYHIGRKFSARHPSLEGRRQVVVAACKRQVVLEAYLTFDLTKCNN
jgi:hypothetical protein